MYLYHQVGNDIEGPVIIEQEYSPMKNLILILILVYLFSSNYYMLSITAKDYLEKFDHSFSYVGLLNACTPLSSIIFGIMMRIWTRYGYRFPIGVAAFMVLAGNLIQAIYIKYG